MLDPIFSPTHLVKINEIRYLPFIISREAERGYSTPAEGTLFLIEKPLPIRQCNAKERRFLSSRRLRHRNEGARPKHTINFLRRNI